MELKRNYVFILAKIYHHILLLLLLVLMIRITNAEKIQYQQYHSSKSYLNTQPEKDKYVKALDIEAVEGRMVSLPCPISSPLEDVYMVLWFRDNAGIPLYSFDVRDKSNIEKPRHWSAPEVFGSRAKFNFDSSPASLDIKDIKRHDQGIYRCRIDFRTSQTQSFRYNLSVIILPEQPIILDRWGRLLNGSQLGPKQEGDDIVITCRVVGGRPQPQVRWLVNGLLVDNQYEHNSGDVIENRLLWPAVQRTDLHSVFTCQAVNTLLVKPKEKSFILDMHLKPLTVKIINPQSSMVADRRYEVLCESTGSRPNAIITWYKGKRQLRRTKDDVLNNTTRSELSFVPTTDDDGKSITCRAENPNVNGLFLETSWKLNVVYPPLVTLRLGSTLSSDDIKEGDDVYFECHVQSNPHWRKLLWLHNGIHLEHNTSARVIRSNQSLVLQKITKSYAGNYACSAINDEGETVSNHLPLRIKYAPLCKHSDRVVLIGASKDETVEILCEIQADPPPRTFRWKFNNSGETLDVGSERFTTNGTLSILKYTPVTDQDYGTLSCWAINEVGTQNQPCMFQVILAGLPSAVSNCTIFNHTDLTVEIQCIPGYDGGLPQIFVLELFSIKTRMIRFNLTNSEEPQFILDNLDALTTMMATENNSLKVRIYAINQKGRSPTYVLQDFLIGSTSYKKEDDTVISLSPVLIGTVLTIIVISFVIALRIFIVTFLQNLKDSRQQSNKVPTNNMGNQHIKPDSFKKCGNFEKPRWQHTDVKSMSTGHNGEDEKDPDVIPPQYSGNGTNSTGKDQHPFSKWSSSLGRPLYDTALQATIINKTGVPYRRTGGGGGVGVGISQSHMVSNVGDTMPLVSGCITSAESNQNIVLMSPTNYNESNLATATHLIQTNVISNVLATSTIVDITPYDNNGSNLSDTSSTDGRTQNTIYNTNNGELNRLPITTNGTFFINSSCSASADLDDININAIKDCLMAQRVPESCV